MPSHTTPRQAAECVGREDDVGRVRGLLADHRLVSLIGPGGIGKTTLARLVVDTDATPIVDLTTITADDEVAAAVARALEVAEQSTRSPADQVFRHLGDRPARLVLDNCEHLIDGVAGFVAALLTACPGTTVLTTSTERLDLPSEQIHEVPPLETPDLHDDFDEVSESAAVRLLVDRAARVAPSFRLLPENRQDVVELCRRLDGLPLAIELAAVRLRVLSVAQLNERLDQRFRVLTGGSRHGPERHQTLRALVEWSLERCSPAERLLWARLSVFRGSFSLDAVEQVCGFGELDPEDVLDVLDGLVSRSVVGVERGHRVRYRQLVTLRDFGAELLRASGEEDAVRARLLDHYLTRSRDLDGRWFGASQAAALAEWRAEHPSMVGVVAWAHADPDRHDAAAELLVLLRHHWIAGGQLVDGRRWLDLLLTSSTLAPTRRGHVLAAAAWVALIQGDRPSAATYLAEADRIATETSDDVLTAYVNAWTGLRQLFSGDLADARESYLRAIPVLAAAGHHGSAATARFQLALAQLYAGDPRSALATCRAVVVDSREVGEQWNLAYALWVSSVAHWHLGEVDGAENAGREALRIQQSFEDGICIALQLLLLSWTSQSRGHEDRARVLAAAADVAWGILGTDVAAFGPHLAQEAQRRTPEHGPGDLPDGLATKAGALAVGLEAVPAEGDAAADHGLTQRQWEVVLHLVEGRSNKDIAAVLVVSPRTVEGHVENILDRLGLASRAEVPAWFTRQSGGRAGANA